jgi:hypothetical protein
MRHLLNSSTSRWGLLVTVIALALLVVLLSATPGAAQGTIHKVYITNVTDQSFTVSWTTDTAVTSSVHYGTSTPPGSSKADSVNPTAITTHHIDITGLVANTTYFFETVSGSTVDNNGGAYYSVTTGPSFIPPTIGTVYGYVYYPSVGTGVNNAIVYLQAGQCANGGGGVSQLASYRTVTGDGGVYIYTLGNLRTANFQLACNPVAATTITVTAQGGSLGINQVTTPASTDVWQAPDIVLGGVPNAITLRSLTSRADASVWVPVVGLTVLGTAAIIIVRRRRS